MLHILLDNGRYDSTGGQLTTAPSTDFTQIASSAGYLNSYYAHNLSDLEEHIIQWHKNPKLTFVYLKIAKGSKSNLGRPKIQPNQVKERLMDFLKDI